MKNWLMLMKAVISISLCFVVEMIIGMIHVIPFAIAATRISRKEWGKITDEQLKELEYLGKYWLDLHDLTRTARIAIQIFLAYSIYVGLVDFNSILAIFVWSFILISVTITTWMIHLASKYILDIRALTRLRKAQKFRDQMVEGLKRIYGEAVDTDSV